MNMNGKSPEEVDRQAIYSLVQSLYILRFEPGADPELSITRELGIISQPPPHSVHVHNSIPALRDKSDYRSQPMHAIAFSQNP
jgi:hypothetical protein